MSDKVIISAQQGQVGAQGSSGLQGNQGNQGGGAQGGTGAQGAQGGTGVQGLQGNQGRQGNQGGSGGSGGTGPQGFQGFQATKAAIMDYGEKWLTLICTESPEHRFEDVIRFTANAGKTLVAIDHRFISVCASNSIDVVGLVASDARVQLGGYIENGVLMVDMIGGESVSVTAKISGIRKGRAGQRFVETTEDVARKNELFWRQATC